MELSEVSLGAKVVVPATVQNLYAREGDDPARQSCILLLRDGQTLNTNIRNLQHVPSEQPVETVAASDALDAQRAEFEKQLQDLQGQLDDAKAQTGGTQSEMAEWKTKAEQAEATARDVATQLENEKARVASLSQQLDDVRKELADVQKAAKKPAAKKEGQ